MAAMTNAEIRSSRLLELGIVFEIPPPYRSCGIDADASENFSGLANARASVRELKKETRTN